MSFIFLAVLVAVAVIWAVMTARSKVFVIPAVLAGGGVALSAAFLYLFTPTFTPLFLIIFIGLHFVIALCFRGIILDDETSVTVSIGLAITSVILIILIVGAVFVVSTDTLARAPNVSTVAGPVDMINSSHIRIVSLETATWRADKAVGSLGYKSGVARPNIQMHNGILEWIAPLDYNDWVKAMTYPGEGTGGYVIVNAEDPRAEAVLVPIDNMAYTPGAPFNNNVNRIVWEAAPDGIQQETNFQIDDQGNPQYVVLLAQPLFAGMIGAKPNKVAVVDPTSGSVDVYPLGKQPAWIERAFSESAAEEYIGWWGTYSGGYLNSILGQRDVKGLSNGVDGPDTYLVNGNDGRLYWFGTLTTLGTDTSMVGYMLVDSKTGKFTYTIVNGYYNDEGAAKNVNQNPEVAKAPELRAVQPIMYIIDGVEVWIVPVITPAGEQTLIGLVDARSGSTYIGSTLDDVLKQWKGAGPAGVIEDSSISKKIEQIRTLLNEIENQTAGLA